MASRDRAAPGWQQGPRQERESHTARSHSGGGRSLRESSPGFSAPLASTAATQCQAGKDTTDASTSVSSLTSSSWSSPRRPWPVQTASSGWLGAERPVSRQPEQQVAAPQDWGRWAGWWGRGRGDSNRRPGSGWCPGRVRLPSRVGQQRQHRPPRAWPGTAEIGRAHV